MKWLIASDIHGCVPYAEKMMERYHSEKADRLLLLGDYLYHGPRNGVPENYDPIRVAEILNGCRSEIVCVQGNCDSEVDQMCLEFPITMKNLLIPIGRHLIFVTHGHIYNKEHLPELKPGDVLLHGHTHVPALEKAGDIWYMNPGSISIPKENSCHSYMLLEEDTFRWKDLLTGETYKEFTLD